MDKQPCIEALRRTYPDIAISVSRSVDYSCVWNGDSPDPVLEGYIPHDIEVTTTKIHRGCLIVGSAYLGSSYYQPGEPIGDIHGYLPQMVDEAMDDLTAKLAAAESNPNL